MKNDLLQRLVKARAEKRPVALVTDLGSGLQTLVHDDVDHGGFGLDDDARAEVRRFLREDRSGIVEVGDSQLFIHSFNPPLRIIIVGAVHIAQALAPIASMAGYDVVVVDPRRAFATDDRFPGITMNGEWPDDALKELSDRQQDRRGHPDPRSQAGRSGAPRGAAVEGVLCRVAGQQEDPWQAGGPAARGGFTESEIGRIHAPVGLSIGAVSPAEIALSIMAQITHVLHRDPPDKAAAA